VDGVAGGDELATRRRVDAVVAGPLGRRARDAEVDLACAGVTHHLDDLARGGATDDRVVDDDHALALEDGLDGVQLEANAEVPDRLLRLDEGAADVVRANEPHLEGDLAGARVTD